MQLDQVGRSYSPLGLQGGKPLPSQALAGINQSQKLSPSSGVSSHSRAGQIQTAIPPNTAATDNTRFEKAMDNIHKAEATLTLLHGYDNLINLGLMALGGEDQLEEWRKEGFEVKEETLLAAGKAFQEGAKNILQGDSPTSQSLAMNRYQLVAGSQEVPDWFLIEQSKALQMIEDPELKAAFEQGETHHISQRNPVVANASKAYASVSGAS